MKFSPVHHFSVTMKRKYCRFKATHYANNLSHQLVNKQLPNTGKIEVGAVGVIYEVKGDKLFIGFDKDVKKTPVRHLEATSYLMTIELSLNFISRIEVES